MSFFSSILGSGLGGLFGLVYQKNQDAVQAQKTAQTQALQAAQNTATQADIATNRANQKTPDMAAAFLGNQQAGGAGISSTMLTGPSGVDPNILQLGKNTLLGS